MSKPLPLADNFGPLSSCFNFFIGGAALVGFGVVTSDAGLFGVAAPSSSPRDWVPSVSESLEEWMYSSPLSESVA